MIEEKKGNRAWRRKVAAQNRRARHYFLGEMLGNKLKKMFWVKGRSKFIFLRLRQENLENINQFYKKYNLA